MEKMNKKVDKNQRIQVFARCRPLNALERKQCSPSIVEVVPEKKEIIVRERNLSKEFFFDKVFPPDVKQVTVYKAVVEPLIKEVLMGYNCTVFAYGQTGTGKTYTMEGERSNTECSWEDDPAAGIIPRSLHQLFEELNKEENVEFYVRVSFLELYNEELFDLLSTSELSRLRLYESSKKGSVVIQGLQEIIVNSKDEVYAILEKGTARRQTAATMLNATSSRSHTIFSVTVHIKENTVEGEELLKIGKLNLVDLAGSENVGRSGAVDKRAREAGNINQSLLTLGRVITALIEKQPHVPYRESKLTRLLQDSLGGHTKTSIIATISPAQINFDETISTLDYATKAKSITIKPEVNQKMTKRALIKEYQEKIDRLQRDIEATRNKEGFYIASENYAEMVNEIEYNKTKIKELEDQLETLTEENKMVEDYLNKLKEELAETRQQQEETVLRLSQTNQILNNTQKVLEKTALERDEKDVLLTAHCNTEKKLSHQAKTLLEVTDETTLDIHKLHAKLDRKLKVEQSNDELCQNFKEMYEQQFTILDDMVSTSKSKQNQNLLSIKEDLNQFISGLDFYKQKSVSALKEVASTQRDELSKISEILNEHSSKQTDCMNKVSQDLDSAKGLLSAGQETFLTDTLPLLIQKQQMIFSEMEHWIQDCHSELTKKVNDLHNHMQVQSENMNKNLKEIHNNLEAFSEHHEKKIKDLEDKIQALSSSKFENKKIREQEFKRKEKFFNMLQSFVEEERKWCQMENDIDENESRQLSQFEPEILRNNITELKTIGTTLSANIENSNAEYAVNLVKLNEIPPIVKIEEFSTKLNSAADSQKSLSSEVTKFIQNNQKLEESSLQSIIKSIQDNSSLVQSNLKVYTSEINAIQTSLTDQVNCRESALEEEKKSLVDKVSSTVDTVSCSEKELVQFSENLRKEILLRNLEFKKFISEDLKKDLPTGTTPERKTYDYPKQLAATSPHERILQRIRSYQNDKLDSAVNLPLDSSFEGSDEFKSLSYEDITDCDTESNASSMSDLSAVGLKNKENNFLKPSHLPKLKNKEFRKPSRPASRSRKPLLSKNPPTDS